MALIVLALIEPTAGGELVCAKLATRLIRTAACCPCIPVISMRERMLPIHSGFKVELFFCQSESDLVYL